MTEESRTFGYLCPECGKAVIASRDPFTLAASDAAIECDCGGAVLRTRYDGVRYHITVPCGLCGGTHTAVCPPERMLRGATALACAKTGQFSCFIGPAGTVEQKMKELSILAEKERQDGGENAFVDNVIMYEILSELKDIASRPDGITCQCGCRQWKMRVRRSAVDLICPDCGGRLRIPAATDRDLDDLCCHMKLTIPRAKA
ncbi:MAG: hypothetical protein IJQ81_02640 [Oscillibacter sp.]|nr:hypothetical protein [Oscillibacter sp.]